MTITIALADAGGGTGLAARPFPYRQRDGWRMALDKLAALVEGT
jgi:hypothetical protein